jgi:transcription elongation factor Elf1
MTEQELIGYIEDFECPRCESPHLYPEFFDQYEYSCAYTVQCDNCGAKYEISTGIVNVADVTDREDEAE